MVEQQPEAREMVTSPHLALAEPVFIPCDVLWEICHSSGRSGSEAHEQQESSSVSKSWRGSENSIWRCSGGS